jgi:aminobenzoyl-glutamate utilization protein B
MTGTTVDVNVDASMSNILKNDALAAVAQKNMNEVGGYTMTVQEQAFALELQKSLPQGAAAPLSLSNEVIPLAVSQAAVPSASTDVGDVSWNVPTIGFVAATFVPGVAPHTWQATASAGMSIGLDGMMVAAKSLALTAVDLLTQPELVKAARADFDKELTTKKYSSIIPVDRKPDPNYR